MVGSSTGCSFTFKWGSCLVGMATLVGAAAAEESRQETRLPRQIVVRLTKDVFVPLVENEIDKTTPVKDFILGARVSGQARTTGLPKVSLVEDPGRAAFLITLRGTTVSRTVGRNGPAIVQTRAETQFVATKRIVFHAATGFVAEPAQINARTRTTTEGIGATRRGWIGRLIVRRASRQVAAMRPQVEAIAHQRAETRITAAFDEYLATRLAKVNQMSEWRQAIAILLGSDGEPRFTSSTANGYVQIIASAAGQGDPVELPATGQIAAPVQFWVRQSVLGDKMMPGLDLLEQSGAGLPGKALDVAGAMVRHFGLAGKPDEVAVPLAYDRVGDWILIQMGGSSAELAAQPTSIAGKSLAIGSKGDPSVNPSRAPRMWTSVDGRFTCEAMLVSATTEDVTLKRSVDGKVVTVPLWRLSEADRKSFQ